MKRPGVYGHMRFTEDLRQLAVESFDLAGRLCTSCKNFHTLWPYHRLAEAAGGDVGIPAVQAALTRLLSPSRRKIMIAGSADSGLLAVVARAANPQTDITVLDRCETPLVLSRRFSQRWSLPSTLLHLDLRELSIESHFDLVFVHMLLQFIPAGQHLDVMLRLKRSLRPDGRLLLVFRTSPRIDEKLATFYRRDYPLHLVAQLEAQGVILPETRETFLSRLAIYFEERRMREGTHASRQEVEALIAAAGFETEELTPILARMSTPFVEFGDKIGLHRFLAIARARDA